MRAAIDEWDTEPGTDLPTWMETSIRESDFVAIICTPRYADRANSRAGGVGYEKSIITAAIFAGFAAESKFVPLLRSGAPTSALPSYLLGRRYIDFRNDARLAEAFEELARHLWNERHPRPVRGEKPIFPLDREFFNTPRPFPRTVPAGSGPGKRVPQSRDAAPPPSDWLPPTIVDKRRPTPASPTSPSSLADVIEALPDLERHVVTLYHGEGNSLDEIARLLNVSPVEVRSAHARAMLMVQKAVGRDYRESSSEIRRVGVDMLGETCGYSIGSTEVGQFIGTPLSRDMVAYHPQTRPQGPTPTG